MSGFTVADDEAPDSGGNVGQQLGRVHLVRPGFDLDKGRSSAMVPLRASLTAASRVMGRTPRAFASCLRTCRIATGKVATIFELRHQAGNQWIRLRMEMDFLRKE